MATAVAPNTMTAILKQSRDAGDVSAQRVATPTAPSERLLIKVAFAGICQSDFDIIDDLTAIYRPPVTMGHEFSGVVAEVGDAVEGFSVGDHVVSQTALDVCDRCQACHDGYFELCANKEILGWTHHGGYAEYLVANPRFCHRIDPSVDLSTAALTEVLAIGVEAVRTRGRLQPGETVAVVGPGPCGVLSAFAALHLGAERVVVVGKGSFGGGKLDLLRAMGLTECVDAEDEDPVRYLTDRTGGRFADLVVDATGAPSGFESALRLVKRHGRVVELGSITEPTLFDWPRVCHRAIDLSFAFSSGPPAWRGAVELLERRHEQLKHAVTHVFDLQDFNRGFEAARDKQSSLKVLLRA